MKKEVNKRPQTSAYFTHGSRPGQIYLARLRMQCSNLNHHLCLRYLGDDPSCKCGHELEDVEHYLLECSEYTDIRNSTLATLPYDLDVKTCLYGNQELDASDNRKICRTMISYIYQSNREVM